MDEYRLAKILYDDLVRIAQEQGAPRSAMAAAAMRAGIQLRVDTQGPKETGDWLMSEAEQFADALKRLG